MRPAWLLAWIACITAYTIEKSSAPGEAEAKMEAGHRTLFGCLKQKGKRAPKCKIAFVHDGNWASELKAMPHYVMLYAPWCSACKQLIPHLKTAYDELKPFGIAVGALDVEPNPVTQKRFKPPSFPHLLFCPNSTTKKCVLQTDARTDNMIDFVISQATRLGILKPNATAPEEL
ncbi:hypothetical protein M885DRAFT_520891 [Pelagophyceae sp. CCMP2097]|nr:hypothetical protein M885DRAFT_520891 [Pelagophyceae sp. CCMP2097]